jgi:Fur family ferric uptake transcriptional regulator
MARVAITFMNIHRFLEQAGLRPTLPRVLVLEFFHQHAHEHFSAEQVYKCLNGETRNMSLGTLYRALGLLVDSRLLSSVALGEDRLVYELNDDKPHDHLVCTACGGIREFFDEQIEARQGAVATELDFDVTGRQLVLFGLCAECRNAKATVRAIVRK